MFAGEPGEAERLGVVDRLAIDGEAGGEADPPIAPGRLRIPLVDEVEEEHRVRAGGGEPEPGRPAHVLGDGAVRLVAPTRGPVGYFLHRRGLLH
jgi:hypothetical protein